MIIHLVLAGMIPCASPLVQPFMRRLKSSRDLLLHCGSNEAQQQQQRPTTFPQLLLGLIWNQSKRECSCSRAAGRCYSAGAVAITGCFFRSPWHIAISSLQARFIYAVGLGPRSCTSVRWIFVRLFGVCRAVRFGSRDVCQG